MSYIGNEPIVSATRTVTEITATAGQTTFTANGGYTVGYIDVFVNGAQLQTSDFTATNGSTITLSSPATIGDDIRLVAWGTFSTSNLVSPNYTGTLTGGTGVMNIGSGQIYKDASGNVGIGTSSPSTKLDVNGDTTLRNGSGVIVGNIQNSSGWFDFKGSGNTNGTEISTATALPIRFSPNNTERMRLDSSGRLGINTTLLSWQSHAVQGPSFAISTLLGVDQTGWSTGCYQDTYGDVTGWKFRGNYPATLYSQTGGHQFYTTTSSQGPGNPITWTLAAAVVGSNLQFNSGYGSVATAFGCRAWVNFNGTGTVAIQGSGNVSSITDNGTGNYTVNFATSMPNANYSFNFNCNGNGNNYNTHASMIDGTKSVGSIRIILTNASANTVDASEVSAIFFR